MMIFDLARVQDSGNYYEVEAVVSSRNKDFDTGQLYLPLNNITAYEIKTAISNNMEVRIVKDFQDKEVMPADLIIFSKEETEDDLELFKSLYRKKARQHVTHLQAVVSGLQVYEFIHANTYLASKGFFVHEDNREEEYLKILETGDEDLINRLEIYLNAMDDLSRAAALEKLYLRYYEDIRDADNKEEIVDIFTKFMETLKNGRK